jgi:hypothetical protein
MRLIALAALEARDPSKLPLAKNARYTENGVQLKLGDGMWGPTIKLTNYKLLFRRSESRPGRILRIA